MKITEKFLNQLGFAEREKVRQITYYCYSRYGQEFIIGRNKSGNYAHYLPPDQMDVMTAIDPSPKIREHLLDTNDLTDCLTRFFLDYGIEYHRSKVRKALDV